MAQKSVLLDYPCFSIICTCPLHHYSR